LGEGDQGDQGDQDDQVFVSFGDDHVDYIE
jgi:hypothetical protein